MARTPEPRAFIIENLRLMPAPCVPEIRLYTAHPGTGLGRLTGHGQGTPPYWAYHWAGGTVLARHLLDQPHSVSGKRVLDLGCGSGIVGIAAAKCGASRVISIDVDAMAIVATEVNAEANGITVEPVCGNILGHPPPDVDLILVGDLFYEASLAKAVLKFLRQCRLARIAVLIGDPGRAPLPRNEMRLVAEYTVADFGDARHTAVRTGSVFALDIATDHD